VKKLFLQSWTSMGRMRGKIPVCLLALNMLHDVSAGLIISIEPGYLLDPKLCIFIATAFQNWVEPATKHRS
jgi:hypothetical protein